MAIANRDPEQETIEDLRAIQADSIGLRFDADHKTEVVRAAHDAIGHFGHLDLLVNNAGGHWHEPVTRLAETVMVGLLAKELGFPLSKRPLKADGGAWVEIDGVADVPAILVEAWAHQGPLKGAQPAKVLKDALKLVWAADLFHPGARKILLFRIQQPRGHSWLLAARGLRPRSSISASRCEW